MAQLAPVPTEPESLFGLMSNTVTIKGNVVTPTVESLNADSAEHDPLNPAA